MQELTFEQVEDVSGGIDLDWGSIWVEVGQGALGGSGGFVGLAVAVGSKAGPGGAILFGTIGAAYGGYSEVMRQLEDHQKPKEKNAA
ncbi:hypothetical protein WH43_01905 [Rheinheimera sp. KL1]|uniref:hypothetical protein n=1 Tax=Rheinheimera sp. KL1 TaxID=1635005 RepID=UPI0006A9596B|nr:hypothetical protein [Rheinheimera sp. KL1]KOO59754.1 hypothetical protein WH43_01905 [Rheinheimera sp. KL1]